MAKLGLPNFFDESDDEEWDVEEDQVMMVIPAVPESSFPGQGEQREQERSRLTFDREQASSSRDACPAGETKLSKSNHHSKAFKCNLCDFISNFDNTLTRHVIKHHYETICPGMKCYFCDFVGKTDGGLKTHMTCMHVNNNCL